MENQPHQSLLKSCVKGDPRAQHRLFHLYVKRMYNTVLRIVEDTAEAEDVVQEGFVKAFAKLSTFRHEANFSTWLTRIMVNTALNKLKKKELKWVVWSDEEAHLPEEETEEENSYLEHMPSPATVNAHIRELPQGCRQIFSLYLLEGYEQKEIAEILNISVSTVKSQYRRARHLLRKSLSKEI